MMTEAIKGLEKTIQYLEPLAKSGNEKASFEMKDARNRLRIERTKKCNNICDRCQHWNDCTQCLERFI